MPAIFISYRRADSAAFAGRIDDQLVAQFGRANIFKDVDSIPVGVDFTRYIEEAIRASVAVLVVIGPRWLDAISGRKRRLDDPADFVRIEIETALRLGVTVIPLLVDGAIMPGAARLPGSLRPLATMNALPVRNDPDFHRDMERLIVAVERVMMAAPPVTAPVVAPNPSPLEPATPPATEPAAPPHSASAPLAAPTVANTPRRLPVIARAAGWRRRAPLITAISALALIAIAVTVTFSPPLVGLAIGHFAPTRLDPTVAAARTYLAQYNATATAQATAKVPAQQTQTAQLARITAPYAPNGIGPCDKDPNDVIPPALSLWIEDTSHGQITCPQTGLTELSPTSSVTLLGLPIAAGDSLGVGFAKSFTLSAILNFHGDIQYAGVTVSATDQSPGGNSPTMTLGTDGSWSASWDGGRQSGNSTGFATYTVTITVTATTIRFGFSTSYGMVKAGPAIALHPNITGITFTLSSGNPTTRLDITDFVMTPA